MQLGERPVLLLGHGIRLAGADPTPLLELGIPVLTSWQAKDLVDNFHPNYFGSPGQYGQRIANKVLYEADQIIAIGNRLSIWNVGYEGPRPDQQIIMVDIDGNEVVKFPQAVWIKTPIQEFINSTNEWRVSGGLLFADRMRSSASVFVESPTHDDCNGYINSYRFVQAIQPFLRPQEIITCDVGGVQCPVFQVLQLRPPQRLLSSGGLGEMGCGIPAAIGASFATQKGEVICFVGDGGFMMNMQELQTIIHHKLPIKIIVFENDGYSMIKRTQEGANFNRFATDGASGISCPNIRALAHSWGFAACDVTTWDDFHKAIPALFAIKEPAIVVYHMDPEQKFYPKLDPIYIDGKPTSPRFCDMSPQL